MSVNFSDRLPLLNRGNGSSSPGMIVWSTLCLLVCAVGWALPSIYDTTLTNGLTYTWLGLATGAGTLEVVTSILSYSHLCWAMATGQSKGYKVLASFTAVAAWATTSSSYLMTLDGTASSSQGPTMMACVVFALGSLACMVVSLLISLLTSKRSTLGSPRFGVGQVLVVFCVLGCIGCASVVAGVDVDQSVSSMVFPYFGPLPLVRTTPYDLSCASFALSTLFASIAPLLATCFFDLHAIHGATRGYHIILFIAMSLVNLALGIIYILVIGDYKSDPVFLFPYHSVDYWLVPIPFLTSFACIINLAHVLKR